MRTFLTTGRARGRRWALARRTAALLAGFLLWATPAMASTNITAVEGSPFSGTLYSVETQCSDATVTSATVTWGDGTTSAATVAVQQTPPSSVVTFVISGTHTYARYGTYAGSVALQASCSNGQNQFNSSGTFSATVSDAPLTATGVAVSAVPGTAFTATVAHLSDANPDGVASDDTASINWGDDATSAGSITSAPGGGFNIAGTHTYTSVGQYVISVSVTSSGGSHASVNATGTVAEPASSPAPPTSPVPSPSPGPTVSASFTTVGAATPGGALLDASASAPSGTTATHYDWKLASAPGQDIVCPGTEPELQLHTLAAANTNMTLTTTDAATGTSSSFTRQLVIPSPARVTGHTASGLTASAVSVTGVCSGSSIPKIPPLSGHNVSGSVLLGQTSIGGAPPADCDQDLVFGAADVHGCLNQIPDPKDLPGGITSLFSTLLCGAKDSDFCLTSGAFAAASAVAHNASVPISGQKAGQVAGTLAKLGFPTYYSYTAIRLDGVDIVPQNGYPILIVPAAHAIVSPQVRIYLDRHLISPTIPLALYIPVTGGNLATITLPKSLPLIGSLPFNGSISASLNRAGTRLSNGDTCQYACAALSVSAELPGVFSDDSGKGLSAAGVITADAVNGVQLDSLEVQVPSAQLAGIGVSNVDIRYSHANESLHAQATVNLFDAAGNISGSVDFVHGAFQAASVSWDAGDGPGIDLGGPLNIYLTHLGGSISLNPTTINATGTITGGPQYEGCALFGITGSMTATFGPFSFDANANGQLLCQNVSNEYFHVDDSGSILIGAQINISLLFLQFSGGLAVAGDIPQGHIQADANMSACVNILGSHCVGAEVVVSDRGIGLCADLGFTHAGGGVQFPDTVLFFTHTCDIGKFRSLGFVTRAGHASTQGFAVPRGQAVTVIGVTGSGAAPHVTLHGPHGEAIDTPAGGYLKTANEVIFADDTYTHETYFFLHNARPGAWTITPDAGSPAITGVQQAAGLPSPDVHATLAHRPAGRLQLRYHLHSLAGQRVTFVERDSQQRTHTIATARSGAGSLTFTPSPFLAERRTILAEVTQDGQPREDDAVAHYRVPPRPPLSAPRHLAARRAGGVLRIHWSHVTGANGYSVNVTLAHGSRRFVQVTGPAATMPQFPSGADATISVRALVRGVHTRPGRPAIVKLPSTKLARRITVKPA
jgi:hypothetical protein